ncbi:MAG: HAD family phosphatase [Erysipelotrichaceae bacterium]|nr:HAD family phosphatase [Erysipelotrichaceae bacterium]
MNLNEKIKAFLFDIDGTLVDRDLKMSENMREALRILNEKGYHVSINTGRPYSASSQVMGRNGVADLFEYYFGSNGVEIYDSAAKEKRYVACIEPKTLKDLDPQFREDYLALALYDDKGHILFNHMPASKEHVDLWCRVRFCEPVVYDYAKNEKSFPKAALLFEPERRKDFEEKMNAFHDERVDFFFSGDHVMEVVPKGLNKGRVVYEYADILGIDPKEILCIGDQESDVSAMLNGTGLLVGDDVDFESSGIAYKCADVYHDGVYDFLKANSFLN